MTLLWIGIGVLTLIAVIIVFWPLLRSRHEQTVVETEADRTAQNIAIFRERLEELEKEKASGTLTETSFLELKTELEKNLLIDAEENRRQVPVLRVGQSQLITITLLALLVPTLSFGLYAYLGRADDLASKLAMDSWQQAPLTDMTIEEAIAQLESELERRPQNAEGWYLLATTRMNMNQFDAAVEAFRQSLKHLPEQTPEFPMVMGQLAQAMFFAAQGEMTDAVITQVEATLRLDPDELTALGLLGIAAFEVGEYEAAIMHWERALRSADGQSAESLQTGIARARAELGQDGQSGVEPEGPGIRIDLDVDPAIATEIRSDQFVFVYARAPGERMPITVERIQVGALPAEIFLSASSSMVEGVQLSDFESVDLVARISVSGTAEQQSGDFKGELSNVKVADGDMSVRLVISERVE
ncbi:MAG: c-type cytochrome biogenesis protein CcmI [Nitrincola lacisaponensis]|uniref:Cytochrome c heme lyase subunit CcmH n=1 Tax=Nitrincola lacisaponensis TaxID=267850 RepID=A0A063Y763_9GAMM|nr:c-type cytochrome biogenesis protein CcmI [Nitrincola lacisaponensis]KDE40601.1 Cytochrome c heme lyase subunit CcmH [Nitrincola lacisaponensis]